METTKQLASFVSGLTFDRIPDRIKEVAKISLLDSVGVGLFGSTLPWSKEMIHFVKSQGGVKESTLWGTDYVGPSFNVALALGTMVHSFELDDYHPGAKLHPSAAVVPAAVAVGEREGINGKDLLTALVAGFETMIRVSLGTGTVSSRLRGFHLTGTCGTFGAAAAVGNLLKLNTERMANALGLAGAQSAGLMAFTSDGSNSKRLHPGRAAQSGILSVSLARNGYTGPTKILEYEDGGFCKATSDETDLRKITEGLGEHFTMEDITIKPYSCCGSLHSSIDCSLELMKKNQINPDLIERVLIHNSRVVQIQCDWVYEPVSLMQAQMNTRYAIAVAILDGDAFIDQFTDAKISDPKIVAFTRKVDFVVDPEIDRIYPRAFPGKVEIFLKDGKRYVHSVDGPKGSPQNPLNFEGVAEKCHKLLSNVKGPERSEEIIQMVRDLEKLENVNRLTRLLQ